MDGYSLSRKWFDWCFENPEKINPNHSALYFFAIEHCNRLGWKEKFGFPMQMAKEAIGISNYRTYSNTLSDLIEWGFIIEVQKSKNQYSSCIIAIAENTIAHTKALDKALQKHSQKQVHGIVCIDKQETDKQETDKQFEIFWSLYPRKDNKKNTVTKYKYLLKEHGEIIKGLEPWISYWRVMKTETRYMPMATTFLNGEQWKDKPPIDEPKTFKQSYSPFNF